MVRRGRTKKLRVALKVAHQRLPAPSPSDLRRSIPSVTLPGDDESREPSSSCRHQGYESPHRAITTSELNPVSEEPQSSMTTSKSSSRPHGNKLDGIKLLLRALLAIGTPVEPSVALSPRETLGACLPLLTSCLRISTGLAPHTFTAMDRLVRVVRTQCACDWNIREAECCSRRHGLSGFINSYL